MKSRKLIYIYGLILILVVGVVGFLKNNILFGDTKVFLLNSNSDIPYKNSYIKVIGFKLEDDIVRIDLISPSGSYSEWKEEWKDVTLSIDSEEYQLVVNVVTEVTTQETMTTITCIGEVSIDELSNEHSPIYLITPYGKIEIDYIEKHKLYY